MSTHQSPKKEFHFYNDSEKLGQKLNRRPHITELPISWNDWYLHFNWLYIVQLIVIPTVGLTRAFWTPLLWQTGVWAFFYYFVTGIGITAGYHRLWAHRSYSASIPLEIYLAAAGAGAVEGSIRHWSREHRAHHRFTDTDKDPYSVKKGIIYAHMGWLVMKQHPNRMGRVDISDLNHNTIVMLQHRYYIPIALFTGYAIPTLVASLWGDPFGGFIYAGILRIFLVNQATFAVNSLAHWLGEQPFDDRISPRDHIVTALATMGEGYHNFHHEFPSDYRNAIKWHQYDPTKWVIWTWKLMSLACNLQEFPTNEIEKGQVQQIRKKLDQRTAKLDWGVPLDQLPVLSWDEFQRNVKGGSQLIAISGVIHDVSGFINNHPGGRAMISSGIGKDMTALFNGGIYNHTNAAHNLLAGMRLAALRGGVEVEAWKESYTHNIEPCPSDLKPGNLGGNMIGSEIEK